MRHFDERDTGRDGGSFMETACSDLCTHVIHAETQETVLLLHVLPVNEAKSRNMCPTNTQNVYLPWDLVEHHHIFLIFDPCNFSNVERA